MILNLEQQVCSLESAKKLKELGFRQDSLFYWVNWLDDNSICIEENKDITILRNNFKKPAGFIISAYTASELGELLPTDKYNFQTSKHMHKDDSKYNKWFIADYGLTIKFESIADTESEVRALLLIYLSTLEKKG